MNRHLGRLWAFAPAGRPAYPRGGWNRRRGWVALPVLMLAGTLLLSGTSPAMAQGATEEGPNYFERQRIETQVLEAFTHILTLWREEVYFELYDLGTQASKARISREAFAQRMVELSWVPDGQPSPKHLQADFRFRTLVYVRVRIPYRNKFDAQSRFSKEQTLLMQQEEGIWRIDLIRLIRSPYS